MRAFDVNSENKVTLDGTVVQDDIVALYDNYDRAFADFINFGYTANNGSVKRIPTVFATVDRAFSRMAEELARTSGKDVTDPKFKEEFNPHKIPLPIISMNRSGFVFDPVRYQKNKIRKRFQSIDGHKWVGCKYPYPVNLKYEIEVWSKTLRVLSSVQVQMATKFVSFGNATYFSVHHPIPIGRQNVFVKLEDWGDNSDLESVGDGGQRKLRHTYVFTVQGWITLIPEIIPAVLSVHADVVVEESNGDLTPEFSSTLLDSGGVESPPYDRYATYDTSGKGIVE